MSEPRTKTLKTVHSGEIFLTERELTHPQTKKKALYFSISNGSDVAGVYLDDKVKKQIADFLTAKPKKEGKKDGNS